MSDNQLHIIKMHGTGNDFVVINQPVLFGIDLPELARKLCDRHFGVGADGMLILSKSDCADIRMRIFNSDGSEAQMCGNGSRCVGKYIYDSGLVTTLTPRIETLDGIKSLQLHLGTDGMVETVTVDMGVASFSHSSQYVTLSIPQGDFIVYPISTGNPHGVVFVNSTVDFPVESVGPQLECHPFWPEKANIEFISLNSDGSFFQRTWERGAGETLACGTGACAAAFVATTLGKASWPIKIQLKGGFLTIDFRDGRLFMTGNAVEVFRTVISC